MSGSGFPDSEVEAVVPPTADIIQFPVRPGPEDVRPEDVRPEDVRPEDVLGEEVRGEAVRGEDRLARALDCLNAALAEQNAALAAWRSALGALQASTHGLGDSLQQYQATLATLDDQAEGLHDRAITMEQWADGVRAD